MYLTGYLPPNGFGWVVYPAEGEPALVVPACDEEIAPMGWVRDVRTFGWGTLDAGDPYESIAGLLGKVKLPRNARIGYEGSFESVAPSYVAGEVMVGASVTLGTLRKAYPQATLADATGLLYDLRAIKDAHDVAMLRRCNRIAQLGIEAFKAAAVPGALETQIAAAVESAVHIGGVGMEGALCARGYAMIVSGARTATCYRPYYLNLPRQVEEGDLVQLELATMVDGYWSDLTRFRVAGGRPTQQQSEVYGAVKAAVRAALGATRDGAPEREIDAAARSSIERAGYGAQFVHHTGHGVGVRYHEPVPFLHPSSGGIVRTGMVTSVEPGIYIQGFGGIRIEENVLVTDKGADLLSVEDEGLA